MTAVVGVCFPHGAKKALHMILVLPSPGPNASSTAFLAFICLIICKHHPTYGLLLTYTLGRTATLEDVGVMNVLGPLEPRIYIIGFSYLPSQMTVHTQSLVRSVLA